MLQEGKILFYNEQSGDGIIITPQEHKIPFDINSWEDFQQMPSLGLDVIVEYHNEKVSKIYTQKKQQENKTSQQAPQIEETKAYKTFRYKDEELLKTDGEVASLLLDANKSLKTVHENIALTSNISKTMQNYFSNIYQQIQKREGYKKVDGRIEYILAKRFLWTTYNNLKDIDPNVITPRIKSIGDDLLFMSNIEDDFQRKIRYPALTFEEIFLANQTQYKKIKKLTDQTFEKLSLLREKEKTISAQKHFIHKEITLCTDTEQRLLLEKKEKMINGTYVDTVHVMASLQENYIENSKRLKNFEQQYKEDFNKEFKKEAKRYSGFLTEILNAQAFLLDSLLWQEAKISKPIRKYLQELSIDIEFNTKEYLKYFLNTLDATKSNEYTKELFTLYEHLKDIYKDYILIITASTQDALEYQYALKELENHYKIKSFVDELIALKWSIKNNVKLIIIEEQLNITTAKKFLNAYHTNILSKPKIILIGKQTDIHSDIFSIDKILPPSSMPYTLAEVVKKLIDK